MLLGNDLEHVDAFTLNLLTNDEVLAIDQDALGHQATTVAKDGQTQVLAKRLEDGSIAVGLFNLGPVETTVTANWSDLGIVGARKVRDLWQQKDLGSRDGAVDSKVQTHGVVLLKLWE